MPEAEATEMGGPQRNRGEAVHGAGNILRQVFQLAAALRAQSREASQHHAEDEASANRLLEAVLAEFSDDDLLGEIARRLRERASESA